VTGINPARICVIPRTSGVGGMVSFQYKLAAGLKARNVEVCDDLADTPYQAVLTIGGTRNLAGLWRARLRGIPVIQRLDGINWLHRVYGPRRSGLRHYLRAEYGNLNLRTIRARLANRVVYQSRFVRRWWEGKYGATTVPNTVIYNGVDLKVFTPNGKGTPPDDRWRVLMVEGSLMGGYEQGIQVAVEFAGRLAYHLRGVLEKPSLPMRDLDRGKRVELMIVGRVAPALQKHWESRLSGRERFSDLSVTWAGLVPADRIPEIDRSAHLLFSADVNPACPNSVIEAMACGLPVVAFDTGALPELVTGDSGRVIPHGGDPWRLDQPDVDSLAATAVEILDDLEQYRKAARTCAESTFSLDSMVEAYLDVLLSR